MTSVKFVKYHGAGNDFILIEDYEGLLFSKVAPIIPKLCHRGLGIGADGILLLQPSQIADVKMRIFNSDGSEAAMCGNGLRCTIHHLNKECTVETKAGLCKGSISGSNIYASLPKSEILQSGIDLDGKLEGTLIDTGVLHLVVITNDLTKPDLMEQGKKWRSIYNANVSFAKIEPSHIHMRTYEKGVENETLACGTGGGAVALAMHLKHKIPAPINVLFASNEFATYFIDDHCNIWMEGPSEVIFSGIYLHEGQS